MLQDGQLYIGTSRNPDDSLNKGEYLELKFGNRHGLITGATGTGKTVTLQVLAEGFSKAGVPVFCADIKGDLSGIAAEGEAKDWVQKRAEQIGFTDFPTANRLSSSGISMAKKAIACVPPSPKWGRCCSPG